jgi:DNA/RNA-binding domain of Phe-tRNA-synthetase-like protein
LLTPVRRESSSRDILENLPQMPLEKLHEAGKMLTDSLEKMMPGLWFEVALIEEQHQ